MMEQILERENMLKAWQRVKSNAGSPGLDGMTVEEFSTFCREHWPRIRSALMERPYRPAPVRRVLIPKLDETTSIGRQRKNLTRTILQNQ